MSKRPPSSQDEMNHRFKKLKQQLQEMQEELQYLATPSPSEQSRWSYYSEGDIENYETDSEEPLEIQNPLEPEVSLIEAPDNEVQQNFSFLGSRPTLDTEKGPPLHKEIVVRWNLYLRKGVSKDLRKEVIEKYKIPSNCQTLTPPLINSEILLCLPKFASEHDSFMMALQQQLAHGLSGFWCFVEDSTRILFYTKGSNPTQEDGVGLVIDNMLPTESQSENLNILAEASQLFANVHYAISAHCKFKITPHLNPDCRKVAKTLEIDEFLLSKNFAEAVKKEHTVKKASTEFKRKIWQPPSLPGPSGVQSRQHLNYQRPQFKTRLKGGREERRPSERSRTNQPRGVARTSCRAWEQITKDRAIVSWIKGVQIPFASKPNQTSEPTIKIRPKLAKA
ncbi:hypothetical protein NQ315_016707 [Exocentrus adspersus]|uniref:Uncharacterized protein n=1 Tax=Exocentrus adspersus TaxID=1586481 RepID=A0AAV8VEJ4_9CUCU|nr:hypothetical protein NQ315_016707 [Exocentrus adspersus]